MRRIKVTPLSQEEKKKVKKKFIILILLILIFIIDLIYVTISNRNERKKYYERMQDYQSEEVSSTEPSSQMKQPDQEQQQDSEEKISDDRKNDKEENEVSITNMDSFVVPMLKDNSDLIEKSLSEFSNLTNKKIEFAEVLDVVCKDDEDPFYLFFIEGEDGTIYEVLYNIETKNCETKISIYTKDEVLSGIWNGEIPECRDEEENTVTE